MAVFYVYILETTTKQGKKSYYTGYTSDLWNRLKQHKNGRGAKFCRGKDIELKYFESYFKRKAAMNRELEIKSFSRKEKHELVKSFQKRE
jgi:putative endonuclease